MLKQRKQFVALLCLLFLFFFQNTFAQSTAKISITLTNSTINELIKSIEKQTNYTFTFDNSVDLNQKITLKVADASIQDVLKKALTGKSIQYEISGQQIILKQTESLKAGTRKISGKILDAQNNPIIGVTIIETSTSKGTISDVNGNFAIQLDSKNPVLDISFIGYVTQKISVGSKTDLLITLQEDQKLLDEVVVVGYGTQKKRDVIGSVAKVTSNQITSLSSGSLDGALQGSASGLQVSSASGSPGAISRIMIRGTNSLSSATEPLWVIDGIIVGSNLDNSSTNYQTNGNSVGILSTINPNDIESLEVLKDAAATAIYGQRGSNGVIIVTTKSGKSGVAESNFSYSQGFSDLTKRPEDFGLATTKQWFDIMESARGNSNLIPVQYDPIVHGRVNSIDNTSTLTRDQALATQTDWAKQILRTGGFKEINFSTTNGTPKGSYFLSGNYRRDESVIQNESLERFSLRSNMDFNLTNNLKLEGRVNLSYLNNIAPPNGGAPGGNNNTAMGGFNQSLTGNTPWMPVYQPNDPAKLWNTLSGYNIVASNDPANIRSEAMKYRILTGGALTYNVPFVKGLSLRAEASMDLTHDHNILWSNTVVRRESAYGFDDKSQYRHLGYNAFATYSRTFNSHAVNLVAGFESEMISTERSYIEGDKLSGTLQQVGSPGNPIRLGSAYGGERYLQGYFGRANYKFMDKYLLGVSFRRDGTSEFIDVNRWANFSAFSGGWILSDEAFMKEVKFVDLLKIRGSFGQTGNANIPAGIDAPGYLDWLRYGQKDLGITKGTTLSSLAVKTVSWETTNSTDYGVDFGFLKNRINGSIAYYSQKVTDMLLATPIPISSGIFSWGVDGSIWNNIGDMRNSGVEFNVNTVNIQKKNFKWTSSLNITTNSNEILKLNSALDGVGGGIITGNTLSRTGGSLGTWYLNEFAGVDANYGYPLIYKADNNQFIKDDAGVNTTELNPNYLGRYVDPVTGENVILPATNANTNSNRILHEGKSGLPTYFGGLTNSISYKNFDLSFTFTFSGGNYVYDQVSSLLNSVGLHQMSGSLLENSWSATNTTALLPKLTANGNYDEYSAAGTLVKANQNFNPKYLTDQYLVKGDYIRLRTLRLNYNFDKSVVDKLKLKGLNAYVSANNILTYAFAFKGYDPEGVNLDGNAQNRNLTQGVMGYGLPTLKSINFGINIKF
jgi:TonB-linked SusC/RagA family outer membrane protein